MYPIITISREFGSGGHYIGERVAAQLNIPFLDRDIIEKVAETTGYKPEQVERQGEYTSGWDKFFSGNYYNGIYLGGPQDDIFFAQRDVILEAARKGPCVILGRCADYILSDQNIPVLNVFIHADLEHRIANLNERMGEPLDPVANERLIDKKDKGRRYYYRFYTDREWGAFANYHLNLDSGYLGKDACVDIIVQMAKRKAEE